MDSRLRRLLASDRVSPATRRVLKARTQAEPDEPPRFLTPRQFETLVIAVEALRPPYPHPSARRIAFEIDRRIAEGRGDGWRYHGMPTDGETYARGLDLMDAELRTGDPAAALRRVQRGEAPWSGLDPRRFFEELLVEVTEIVYSHPEVQAAIGYVGFADGDGWHALGPDRREDWE
ncbi:MAG: gluconate 2-dehydrogenase subunit 3 family protein [Fimbriimonas sp.]